MSVRSLAALAVARDMAQPKERVGKVVKPPDSAGKGDELQGFTDTLVSVIPTEPLSAYTALVAAFVVAVAKDASGRQGQYLPLRWWAYGAFLALTAIAVIRAYYVKTEAATGPGQPAGSKRPVPDLELISALAAAAAWGLVMPGSPLSAQFQGRTMLAFIVPSITIGAVAVLTLLVSPLTLGSRTAPAAKDGAEPAAHRAAHPAAAPPAAPAPAPPGRAGGPDGRSQARPQRVRVVPGEELLLRITVDGG